MSLLLIPLSVLAATLPLLGALLGLWLLDRTDRTPLWVLLLTALWGAVGAAGLSLLGNSVFDLAVGALAGPDAAAVWTPVLAAPVIEEHAKAAALFGLVLGRRPDGARAGLLLGAAAGLGFAMTENLLYFLTAARMAEQGALDGTLAWAGTVALRTGWTAPLHASATALTLGGAGLLRGGRPLGRAVGAGLGLCAAIALHAAWNGLLTAAGRLPDGEALVAANFGLFPFVFASLLGLFELLRIRERRRALDGLRAAPRTGLAPGDAERLVGDGWGAGGRLLLPAGRGRWSARAAVRLGRAHADGDAAAADRYAAELGATREGPGRSPPGPPPSSGAPRSP